jgi:hypothetical protein
MDPDPTPTPIYSDLKNAKKDNFFIFFSYNLTAGTLSSVLKIRIFFQNYVLKFLFCKHYFSPLNTFMRKAKDPEPVHTSDSWIRIREAHANPDPPTLVPRKKKTFWRELIGVLINREETKTNAASSEPFLPSALPPSPKKRGPGFKVSSVGFRRVEKCKKWAQNCQ